MAVNDLDLLKKEIPILFEDRSLPTDWVDDWIIIPIAQPDRTDANELIEGELSDPDYIDDQNYARMPSTVPDGIATPEIPGSPFPGSPRRERARGAPPPPDALAFYLPFHYFHPDWWGIYLILEGVHELAAYIWRPNRQSLTFDEALTSARMFLCGHEAFHHATESFATRLEVTHRRPLYIDGFEKHYLKTLNTPQCLEEALANARGYQRVRDLLFKNEPAKKKLVLSSLRRYIRSSPEGYRQGLNYLGNTDYRQGRNLFSEAIHQSALPNTPQLGKDIWLSFPHAFGGIGRCNSRVNYVVHRHSSLANRLRLGSRFLRYRDLAKKLRRLAHCRPVRSGGRHEVWQTPAGHRFPVPKHPGDIATGTLSSIISQAGLAMGVSEFLATKA